MIRRRLLMQMISNAIVHRTLENTYIRNNGIVGGASGNLLHEFSVVSGETYTVHFDKTQLKRIGQSAAPITNGTVLQNYSEISTSTMQATVTMSSGMNYLAVYVRATADVDAVCIEKQ